MHMQLTRSAACSGARVPRATAAPLRRDVRVHYRNWETLQDAAARRERESTEVEARAQMVTSWQDFQSKLGSAGSKLVVLEIDSPQVCELTPNEPHTGVKYTAKELQEEAARLAKCGEVKHTFQRVARACQDVAFYELQVDANAANARELMQSFDADTMPTIQFWRNGRKLWEHRGAQDLDKDLGEGMLYYGDNGGTGEKASSFVKDLRSRAEYEAFVAGSGPEDKMLKVVNFATEVCAPCVHIFPAVVALARNFKDHAHFARIVCDEGDATAMALMREMQVYDVPTFLLFRGGRLAGRIVGSSRGDLIGKILEVQLADGQGMPVVEGKKRAPFKRGLGRTKPRK